MQLFPVHDAVATEPPFPSRDDHPVARQGINRSTLPSALSTNKFYANMFLGDRTQAVWLHPFSVWWSNGGTSWGLSISHVEPGQRVFGPDPHANPVQFYYNPIRIQSLCLSAVELGQITADMNISHLEHMSAQVNFVLRSNPTHQNMVVPLIQGSGFISAIYTNLIPRFDSGVRFRGLSSVIDCQNMRKWRIQTRDGHTWLLYASPFSHNRPANLVWRSNSRLEFDGPFTGLVQLTKLPSNGNSFEPIADRCAGTWATTATLSATCEDTSTSATYTFEYRLHPNSRLKNLFTYALPHHVDSFIPETAEVYSQYRLDSTTKGPMCVVVSNCWQLREQLPHHISFRPESVTVPHEPSRRILARVAREEAQGNPVGESNQHSMYFSGKTLDKYACMCWVICAVLEDVELAQNLLRRVKEAFSRFAENRQRFPLVYEKAWGGLVSSAMYETGDLMQDFGNGCYNDHHFHYGYFIHAAALIAEMDRKLGNSQDWLTHNQQFVDTLVRDTNNANPSDRYFPLSRAFDWFHGHSWAKGLFDSWDGKDQESTSEDAYYSYGLKLWGQVTENKALERRAMLMLAIQRRVFSSYFLMEDSNRYQPANFVLNKVTGILFENKCDHTTYFGHDNRLVQGIHMIPLSPVSHYIRSPTFIREEWTRYFSQDHLTGDDGWKGILYANYSIVEPSPVWQFFSSDRFKRSWLDGGASRTWYLWLCTVHEELNR